MNEIVNFFLPLTFGHIFYVAVIILAAIVCARLALAAIIWLGSLGIGALSMLFVGIFVGLSSLASRRRYKR